MYVARLDEFGAAENLRYERAPAPEPGEGQVRIEVEAAGVHFIETVLRTGRAVGPHGPPALPVVLGGEVAGAVSALGPGVDDRWLGRRVVATLPSYGGYASRAVAGVDALHDLPEGLTADVAVAMVTTGATALGILGGSDAGDVALATSAAGGVGVLLVQALRARGVFVVGAAGGPEKVRQVAADVAVDYRDADWPSAVRDALGGRTVDVVFDGVGGAAGRAAFDLLGPGGTFVLHGWSSGAATRLTTSDIVAGAATVTWALGPRLLRRDGTMRALRSRAIAAAADGVLQPLITRYPLSRAADAHADLESRRTVGKVVLVP